MLEQAILDLQIIERSVAAKTLPNLKICLALRRCMKELRALTIVPQCQQDAQPEVLGSFEKINARHITPPASRLKRWLVSIQRLATRF